MTTTYRTGTYSPTETELLHIWETTDEHGLASALYVSTERMTVVNIETRSDRQGEGLARHLWETAQEQMNDEILHDLPAHRTAEGDSFAEAVGGDSAEECHVAYCVCTEDAA